MFISITGCTKNIENNQYKYKMIANDGVNSYRATISTTDAKLIPKLMNKCFKNCWYLAFGFKTSYSFFYNSSNKTVLCVKEDDCIINNITPDTNITFINMRKSGGQKNVFCGNGFITYNNNGLLDFFLPFTVACMHPNTLVDTNNGMIPIKAVQKGDLVKDINGIYIEVINNIMFFQTDNFVKIKKNALGPNIPSKSIYATEGHPIIYEGKEVTFGDILNEGMASKKTLTPINVYSIQTKVRTPIMMENLPVYTWGIEDWIDFKKKCKIFHRLQ